MVSSSSHTVPEIMDAGRSTPKRAHLSGNCWPPFLVVLGGEVGGRWSEETSTFVRLLAKAKARLEPSMLRTRMELAWRNRWAALLV